jgi:acyl-coenzyme A thioesterase PaaI-like protein
MLLSLFKKMSPFPGGKWLFSRMVCFKAPYFGSIRPLFTQVQTGLTTVTFRKRRAVTNHIGTVHAIAMANAAELAAGTMMEATLPRHMRWIPKGMDIQYLKKLSPTSRPQPASLTSQLRAPMKFM